MLVEENGVAALAEAAGTQLPATATGAASATSANSTILFPKLYKIALAPSFPTRLGS